MHALLQCHGTFAMCYIVQIPPHFESDYLFSAEGKQTCFENSLCKPVMFHFEAHVLAMVHYFGQSS